MIIRGTYTCPRRAPGASAESALAEGPPAGWSGSIINATAGLSLYSYGLDRATTPKPGAMSCACFSG